MATLTINGTNYSFPAEGDLDWGSDVSDWASAVSQHLLQKTGGSFTLSADVDFGASKGLIAPYYKSKAANLSTAGTLRLGNTESIGWRNAANSANLLLSVNSSNELTFNGTALATSVGLVPVASGGTAIASYTAGDIIYASGATTLLKLAIGAANQVMTSSGTAPQWGLLVDANIDAAAAIAYSKLNLASSIVNADISNSAAIAYSKLALTNSIVKGDLTDAAYYQTQVIDPSSPYSVAAGVQQIFWDASGGAKTVSLPTAVAITGRTITVTKTDSSFNAVTIDPSGSETIGGASTTTLDTQGESLTFTSNGSNWLILNRTIPSVWTAYTPVGNLTTNCTWTGFWRRVGDSIEVQAKCDFSGTNTQNFSAAFDLPSGLTLDTAKMLGSPDLNEAMGVVHAVDASSVTWNGYVCYFSTTRMILRYWNGASNAAAINPNSGTPMTIASGDSFKIRTYLLPISGWNG